jgi:hypothetical protein
MSDRAPWRAATLDWLSDVLDGVNLHDLPPFTTLLLRTMNSVYLVVTTPGPEVYVQGGAFPDRTSAYLEGSAIGGSCLELGWIGVGLRLKLRSRGRRIITSPVLAITVVQASGIMH